MMQKFLAMNRFAKNANKVRRSHPAIDNKCTSDNKKYKINTIFRMSPTDSKPTIHSYMPNQIVVERSNSTNNRKIIPHTNGIKIS